MRGEPRTLQVVGLVFVLLSLAMAMWHWARGEPAGFEYGSFTGGLLVLGLGLYLARRRR